MAIYPKIHLSKMAKVEDIEQEFIRLKNSGQVAVDMTGWILYDEAGHKFVFPAFTLEPNAYVRVWTKANNNTSTDLHWRRKQAIWNNEGDCAYLEDRTRKLIDEFRYP